VRAGEDGGSVATLTFDALDLHLDGATGRVLEFSVTIVPD